MTYYKCGRVYTTQNSNVVVDTASGAIANFQTPLAMPLLKTRFDFKATQEAGTPTPQSPKAISGVSVLNVFHRASNFFNIATKTDGAFLVWARGDTFPDAKSIVSDYIEVKEGVKFSSNYFAQWCCYDKNKNYLGNIVQNTLITTSGSDRKDNTIPSGYGVYYLRLGYRSALNNDKDMTEKTDIILNVGDTATAYEPYNGSTTLINLGGTYYGGYVSQDKAGHRQLVVTSKRYDLSALSWTLHQQGFYNTTKPDDMYKYLATETPEWIAERYQKATGQWIYGHGSTIGYIGANGGLIYCTDSTTPSGYLVAPLTEPIIIDLPDGEPIITLNGTNNIFADTGDTSLQFRKIG